MATATMPTGSSPSNKPVKNLINETLGETIANGVTHGIGAIASIVGLAILVAYTALHGTTTHMVAVSLYGASLILLYSASTLYHSIPIPAAKHFFKILDHASIYVLIAGSYTPLALIALEGLTGWLLFGIVWGLAAAGVVFKIFFTGRFQRLSTILYVAMGWMVVFYADSMMNVVPTPGLWLLLAGGLAYTGGVVFYVWESLPYSHAIWHLFVLAGSVLHYLAILLYVVPDAPAALIEHWQELQPLLMPKAQ